MPYLYLLIAIITEITGTVSLKSSVGFSKLFPSITAISMIFITLGIVLLNTVGTTK